jgi:hypothetical protein
MSSFTDPTTALLIARTTRADEIRRAEQFRIARSFGDAGTTSSPRRRSRRLHLAWGRSAAVAH